MNRFEVLQRILQYQIVAIIRTAQDEHIPHIAEALFKGGVKAIEITSNTPNAFSWIKKLTARTDGDFLIGAGTVLNREMAKKFIEAGAKFLVTPFTKKEVIEEAHKSEVPVLSGAMTPGEIAEAYEMGADIVKVFPAEFFGPRYIKAVKAPLDFVKLMPTGGVNEDNIGDWVKSGADALGVGSALFTAQMLKERQYGLITEKAQTLVENLRKSKL